MKKRLQRIRNSDFAHRDWLGVFFLTWFGGQPIAFLVGFFSGSLWPVYVGLTAWALSAVALWLFHGDEVGWR